MELVFVGQQIYMVVGPFPSNLDTVGTEESVLAIYVDMAFGGSCSPAD